MTGLEWIRLETGGHVTSKRIPADRYHGTDCDWPKMLLSNGLHRTGYPIIMHFVAFFCRDLEETADFDVVKLIKDRCKAL